MKGRGSARPDDNSGFAGMRVIDVWLDKTLVYGCIAVTLAVSIALPIMVRALWPLWK